MITHLEGEELRIAIAQAAAMSAKRVRANQYTGAFVIADDILNQTPEVVEHRQALNELVNSIPFHWLETLDSCET